jgi:hypothetical protein
VKIVAALDSKKVTAITELVDSWKFGNSTGVVAARAALKGYKAKTAELQKASRDADMPRIEGILEGLPLDGDGDPVVETAQAMVEDYRAQKYKLGMAVASGNREKVEAAIAAWTYNAFDEALAKAQKFIVDYDDDTAKLTGLIGSKQEPKSISALKDAIDKWPYDPEDTCLVPARARLKRYQQLVEPIQAAMQAKDMGMLRASLGDWEFSKDDAVYEEAMTCMDEFSAQMKVVSAAIEAEPKSGPQLQAALAQLTYTTEDEVDVAQLKSLLSIYDRKVGRLEAAVQSNDLDALREQVDESANILLIANDKTF